MPQQQAHRLGPAARDTAAPPHAPAAWAMSMGASRYALAPRSSHVSGDGDGQRRAPEAHGFHRHVRGPAVGYAARHDRAASARRLLLTTPGGGPRVGPRASPAAKAGAGAGCWGRAARCMRPASARRLLPTTPRQGLSAAPGSPHSGPRALLAGRAEAEAPGQGTFPLLPAVVFSPPRLLPVPRAQPGPLARLSFCGLLPAGLETAPLLLQPPLLHPLPLAVPWPARCVPRSWRCGPVGSPPLVPSASPGPAVGAGVLRARPLRRLCARLGGRRHGPAAGGGGGAAARVWGCGARQPEQLRAGGARGDTEAKPSVAGSSGWAKPGARGWAGQGGWVGGRSRARWGGQVGAEPASASSCGQEGGVCAGCARRCRRNARRRCAVDQSKDPCLNPCLPDLPSPFDSWLCVALAEMRAGVTRQREHPYPPPSAQHNPRSRSLARPMPQGRPPCAERAPHLPRPPARPERGHPSACMNGACRVRASSVSFMHRP
jgi:hypothetical protein